MLLSNYSNWGLGGNVSDQVTCWRILNLVNFNVKYSGGRRIKVRVSCVMKKTAFQNLMQNKDTQCNE